MTHTGGRGESENRADEHEDEYEHEDEHEDELDPPDESGWPVASGRPHAATDQENGDRSAIDPDIDEHRRIVVGGLAAIVGLSGNGFASLSKLQLSERSAATDYRDISAQPHTVATFEALVDAAVPRTPTLASQRGPEHEPGGLDVELERYLVWSLNHLLPFPTQDDFADQVAHLLDQGAALLIQQEMNEDPPTVDSFPSAGLFGQLSRQDRFRAINLQEENGVTIMTLVNILVHFGYYSEWSGYENNTGPPTERTFTGEVQSWEQTAFPGPAIGYRDFRGYLVEEFEEAEFEDDDGGDEDSQGGDDADGDDSQGDDDGGDEDSQGGDDADGDNDFREGDLS
ncbi:hypothetical protein [Salinigranum salinum]|uniref:hypothetical protein n=1 Tax=Salinigranum salinum TaxID=1364937 RepID=UPI001260949F|nr:hypothetical protein [Salinigranum salinum]